MEVTHKDSVKPSIYMFPVVQFFVDMLLDTNTTSSDGFLPVNLSLVSKGVAPTPGRRTVSLIIVPTSRSIFESNTPISFSKSLVWLSGAKASPDLLHYLHMAGVNQLRQRVADHGSVKCKLG